MLLAAAGFYEGAALPAALAGLVIGVLAATAYLVLTGDPGSPDPYGWAGRRAVPTSRSWGSR